jgi:DNA-binding protein HU-beta
LDYNVKHRNTILRGGIMTKEELIEKVATGAKLSKADAARALDATINAVKGALKKGQKVTLFDSVHSLLQKEKLGRVGTLGRGRQLLLRLPRFLSFQQGRL